MSATRQPIPGGAAVLPFVRPEPEVLVRGRAYVFAPGTYTVEAVAWDRAEDCPDSTFVFPPTGQTISWVLTNEVTGERIPVVFEVGGRSAEGGPG